MTGGRHMGAMGKFSKVPDVFPHTEPTSIHYMENSDPNIPQCNPNFHPKP